MVMPHDQTYAPVTPCVRYDTQDVVEHTKSDEKLRAEGPSRPHAPPLLTPLTPQTTHAPTHPSWFALPFIILLSTFAAFACFVAAVLPRLADVHFVAGKKRNVAITKTVFF